MPERTETLSGLEENVSADKLPSHHEDPNAPWCGGDRRALAVRVQNTGPAQITIVES